ncbi:hypothetical protein [Nocardioides dongxiaopingii]|uniref:hypothetical protein n=1 Tax=Nocardioides sp. S-1144 TaxID=2582905 RepID=UPI0016527A0E|nr:hypothetical protein [Nocardioides sp. S-1144]
MKNFRTRLAALGGGVLAASSLLVGVTTTTAHAGGCVGPACGMIQNLPNSERAVVVTKSWPASSIRGLSVGGLAGGLFREPTAWADVDGVEVPAGCTGYLTGAATATWGPGWHQIHNNPYWHYIRIDC